MSHPAATAVSATGASDPILVTGSHRSGTTWAAAILAEAANTRLVYEPFNRDLLAPRRGFDPGRWYRAVDETNEDRYAEGVRHTLEAYGYHEGAVMRVRTARNLARDLATRLEFALLKVRRARVVYKDPIAFFSAEWLARRFGMRPVVMIRHPAAFVSSLLAKGWTFDFSEFLGQPRLMRHLEPFRPDVERLAREKGDIVDQGITLWNCIYDRADVYRRLHPDWIFVRHEDLSLDPLDGFRSIYARLGLAFGDRQRRFVEELSGPQNPKEQTGTALRRDSASNVDRWKRTLEPEQIKRILDGTEQVRLRFYGVAEGREQSWTR